MTRHRLPEHDDVCVDCGRDPSDGRCPGPHPDLARFERDAHLGPATWGDVAATVSFAGILLAGWAAALTVMLTIGALVR